MSKNTIFLDRDGIINKNRDDYVKSIEEFEILPNVPEAIKLLNSSNYQVIVISNQSAVNRGFLSIQTLKEIHQFLQSKLNEFDAKIDAFYYCPHRPDELCDCRKPKSALFLRAAKEHRLDLNAAVMIGDRDSDMIAAQNIGIKFVRMKTNGDLLSTINSFMNNDE